MATNWLSKRPRLISLLFVFVLLGLAGSPAAAQDDTGGVRYVVQPGDTLSSISLRFDVGVDDIVRASGITNPNNLNVGDVLIIPGIDWIEGTLVFENVPLGESYLSIKRRYLLSDENMARLNLLTSPGQLYVGFPAMLATERGELTDVARAAVGPNTSLLELAAATGDNPWHIAAVNQLPGTWAAVKGDVLFTPGRQSTGPGGLPSPITDFSVEDPGFVQGKTLVINATTSAGEMQLSGDFFGHELHFLPGEEGRLIALQGIPLEAGAGTYDFNLSGSFADGSTFTFSQPVRVQLGDYERATLSVNSEELLDPTLSSAELGQVAEIMAPVTPVKLWSGMWGWPHDLVTDVTSGFGEYRSYNGGIAESYHTGTDFGGGALLAIYAPAAGNVVFAGPLDIRGNATIIDHGWGIYTTYYHQQEIYVQVGDSVSPGEIIGIVGKTGRVSGPHLHWEVWVGGVPVEPLDWLARVFP